ncbi:MAG TPA: hypothetical protein PLW25_07450, partial [Anaerolineaceae bacterium]|nr:hypothetical protein [Anaerolineaceae bacterium]
LLRQVQNYAAHGMVGSFFLNKPGSICIEKPPLVKRCLGRMSVSISRRCGSIEQPRLNVNTWAVFEIKPRSFSEMEVDERPRSNQNY